MVYSINMLKILNSKMEEKQLSEHESLALITAMINRTKERCRIGEGSLMITWGYLTVVSCAIVWLILMIKGGDIHDSWWYITPIAGGIFLPLLSRLKKQESGVRSFTDIILYKLWVVVAVTCLMAMIICILFRVITDASCTDMLFTVALVIVPVAEIFQGLVVKEKSYIHGGAIGLMTGLFTLGCIHGNISLGALLYLPLIMLAVIAMMIVPGHIINNKARNQK